MARRSSFLEYTEGILQHLGLSYFLYFMRIPQAWNLHPVMKSYQWGLTYAATAGLLAFSDVM